MPTRSSGKCRKRSEWSEHGTTTTGDVFHFESMMGGPTTHAGTNGAYERERRKQRIPEDGAPISYCQCPSELDDGDK